MTPTLSLFFICTIIVPPWAFRVSCLDYVSSPQLIPLILNCPPLIYPSKPLSNQPISYLNLLCHSPIYNLLKFSTTYRRKFIWDSWCLAAAPGSALHVQGSGWVFCEHACRPRAPCFFLPVCFGCAVHSTWDVVPLLLAGLTVAHLLRVNAHTAFSRDPSLAHHPSGQKQDLVLCGLPLPAGSILTALAFLWPINLIMCLPTYEMLEHMINCELVIVFLLKVEHHYLSHMVLYKCLMNEYMKLNRQNEEWEGFIFLYKVCKGHGRLCKVHNRFYIRFMVGFI